MYTIKVLSGLIRQLLEMLYRITYQVIEQIIEATFSFVRFVMTVRTTHPPNVQILMRSKFASQICPIKHQTFKSATQQLKEWYDIIPILMYVKISYNCVCKYQASDI